MTKLSIIVPCYNEQAALPAFYEAITGVVSGLPGVEPEYLFVDDGSRDNTLPILRELAGRDGRVRYLSFSRNFGKEAAMYAGLQAAAGELCGHHGCRSPGPARPAARRCSASSAPERLRLRGGPPGGPAKESRPSAPSSPGCSTGSSIRLSTHGDRGRGAGLPADDPADGGLPSSSSPRSTASPRASSPGWASAPSGWRRRTLNGPQGQSKWSFFKLLGVRAWTASWPSPPPRWPSPPFLGCSCASSPSWPSCSSSSGSSSGAAAPSAGPPWCVSSSSSRASSCSVSASWASTCPRPTHGGQAPSYLYHPGDGGRRPR